MKTHYYYTFQYPNGKQVLSGGLMDMSITGEVDHEKTKVGDKVKIVQFNANGSFPSEAVIIGKLEYNWDMKKPLGKRKSDELITGVGYNVIL